MNDPETQNEPGDLLDDPSLDEVVDLDEAEPVEGAVEPAGEAVETVTFDQDVPESDDIKVEEVLDEPPELEAMPAESEEAVELVETTEGADVSPVAPSGAEAEELVEATEVEEAQPAAEDLPAVASQEAEADDFKVVEESAEETPAETVKLEEETAVLAEDVPAEEETAPAEEISVEAADEPPVAAEEEAAPEEEVPIAAEEEVSEEMPVEESAPEEEPVEASEEFAAEENSFEESPVEDEGELVTAGATPRPKREAPPPPKSGFGKMLALVAVIVLLPGSIAAFVFVPVRVAFYTAENQVYATKKVKAWEKLFHILHLRKIEPPPIDATAAKQPVYTEPIVNDYYNVYNAFIREPSVDSLRPKVDALPPDATQEQKKPVYDEIVSYQKSAEQALEKIDQLFLQIDAKKIDIPEHNDNRSKIKNKIADLIDLAFKVAPPKAPTPEKPITKGPDNTGSVVVPHPENPPTPEPPTPTPPTPEPPTPTPPTPTPEPPTPTPEPPTPTPVPPTPTPVPPTPPPTPVTDPAKEANGLISEAAKLTIEGSKIVTRLVEQPFPKDDPDRELALAEAQSAVASLTLAESKYASALEKLKESKKDPALLTRVEKQMTLAKTTRTNFNAVYISKFPPKKD